MKTGGGEEGSRTGSKSSRPPQSWKVRGRFEEGSRKVRGRFDAFSWRKGFAVLEGSRKVRGRFEEGSRHFHGPLGRRSPGCAARAAAVPRRLGTGSRARARLEARLQEAEEEAEALALAEALLQARATLASLAPSTSALAWQTAAGPMLEARAYHHSPHRRSPPSPWQLLPSQVYSQVPPSPCVGRLGRRLWRPQQRPPRADW